MTGTSAPPMAKGHLLAMMKLSVRKHHGDPVLEQVIARCAPDTRRVLESPILSNQFYPESVVADACAGLAAVLGREKLRQQVRQMAQDQMSSLFRTLVRLLVSPKMLSANNHRLWEALHNSGTLRVINGDDNLSHTVEISDFDFITPAYEELFIEYHCGVLEVTGVHHVVGTAQRAPPRHSKQLYRWSQDR